MVGVAAKRIAASGEGAMRETVLASAVVVYAMPG